MARAHLSLPDWMFWVAVCEMILVIRLFHDTAAVVPPVQRIVRIFEVALPVWSMVSILHLVWLWLACGRARSLGLPDVASSFASAEYPCVPLECGTPRRAHSADARAALWPL